jgi:catechol 2,3-dioxygenase-like lactoylglutathione lyase family enzyme
VNAAARSRPVTIDGIDHVMVLGPEGCEPEARAFYGELLGLEELPRPSGLPDPDGLWFRVGAQQLHLGIARPFHPALKAHVSFLVENLDELIEQLAARGVEAARDDHIPGVERAFIHDPFGNRIEIRQGRR